MQKKLKKYAITNGRSLKIQIPDDTFFDMQDGNTRNMRVDIQEEDGSPLRVPWLKYDPKIQTIFALPFDENGIGQYIFNIVATNSGGFSVSDKLEIVVRQYSKARLVNHQFNVEFSFANWRPEATKGWEWHVSIFNLFSLNRINVLYGKNVLCGNFPRNLRDILHNFSAFVDIFYRVWFRLILPYVLIVRITSEKIDFDFKY